MATPSAGGSGAPFRVAYVDHCALLSGAELALVRTLPALVDVAPIVILAEDGPLVARLRDAGIAVDVVPIAEAAGALRRASVTPRRLPVRVGVQWLRYTIGLARRLRRSRPDLLQTNSLKAALYGSVAGRLAGVPVVCHMRDRLAEDYLPGPAIKLTRLVVGLLADGVIANSASTMTTLELDRYGADGLPAMVLHDPVPLAPLDRSPAPYLRVGMVGRISPWKGQDVFLRAFAEAFPDGDTTATVVGAAMFGEDGYETEVRSLPVSLGVGDRVTFTGFRRDVPAVLAELDVLVHASVVPEPFGMVVVEGMGAGLAVLASDAGGPAEVVEDGVNGLLYRMGDVHALAGALRRVADDLRLRASLGQAARRRAEDFRPEVAATHLVPFYRQVLAGPRRPVTHRLLRLVASFRPARRRPRSTVPGSDGPR